MALKASKYKSDIPEPRIYSNGSVNHPNTGVGPKSTAEKRALIYPQAEGIIRKFGGAYELARILKELWPDDHWHPSSIFRWMHPKEVGGRGGYIPNEALERVVKAARYAGVKLTINDLYPDLVEIL